MYQAPDIITRGDPRLPAPQAQPTETALPVTPNATAAAKILLAKLYKTRDTGILNGLQIPLDLHPPITTSQPGNLTPSATGRRLALVEFTFNRADTGPLLTKIRTTAKTGQIVVIRWMPPRPTDGALTGPLTDFEWQQMMQPGSDLNALWAAQVEVAAVMLKQLQQEHIAVLWSPYPSLNNQAHWWAGRPGHAGSAALLRMLYQRLTLQNDVRNLLWVWEPAAGGASGNGSLSDFYPGPLYCDALTLDIEALSSVRDQPDRMLKNFGGGKPIGVRIASGMDISSALDSQNSCQWIVLPPADSTDGH